MRGEGRIGREKDREEGSWKERREEEHR